MTAQSGSQPRLAAHDIEELLRPQVGGETGLGNHHVGHLEGVPGGQQAVVPMGDVGEREAMDEHRLAFQGLDQVGLDGVLQQHDHGPDAPELAGADRLALSCRRPPPSVPAGPGGRRWTSPGPGWR